jgi:hypothetical protein
VLAPRCTLQPQVRLAFASGQGRGERGEIECSISCMEVRRSVQVCPGL